MVFRGFQPTPAAGRSVGDAESRLSAGDAESRLSAGDAESRLSAGDASLLFDTAGAQLPGHDGAALEVAFRTAIDTLEKIPTEIASYDSTSNDAIEGLLRLAAEAKRIVDARFALVSGQVERRSAPELGSMGLARHKGHRTSIQMTKVVGKLPGYDAAKAVRAGRLIHETQIAETPTADGAPPTNPITGAPFAPTQSWLAPVGRALSRGMSPAAAESIQRGLGTPTEGVPESALLLAAERLCAQAEVLDPDLLIERARRVRDELDLAGIGLREEERRQKRSLVLTELSNGMWRLVWTMDTETAAGVRDIYDRATSPRRGGPRHGKGTALQAQADSIETDARTTEQIASDVFGQLLHSGADADSSQLLGTGAPAVRILTTHRRPRAASGLKVANSSAADFQDDCERFALTASALGPGWIEGQSEPVSAETVARFVCAGTTTEIPVDVETGQPLDVGREQRLFNKKQRIGIGARDGRCMASDENGNGVCDRPPSWTEVHHIEQWKRDDGRTDLSNGILLCKHHHLNLHNEGWEIHRDGSTYWLIPPVSVDPKQVPRRMAPRNDAMGQLVRFARETESAARDRVAEADIAPGMDSASGVAQGEDSASEATPGVDSADGATPGVDSTDAATPGVGSAKPPHRKRTSPG
jgi:hypothetical protein